MSIAKYSSSLVFVGWVGVLPIWHQYKRNGSKRVFSFFLFGRCNWWCSCRLNKNIGTSALTTPSESVGLVQLDHSTYHVGLAMWGGLREIVEDAESIGILERPITLLELVEDRGKWAKSLGRSSPEFIMNHVFLILLGTLASHPWHVLMVYECVRLCSWYCVAETLHSNLISKTAYNWLLMNNLRASFKTQYSITIGHMKCFKAEHIFCWAKDQNITLSFSSKSLSKPQYQARWLLKAQSCALLQMYISICTFLYRKSAGGVLDGIFYQRF